MTKRRVVVTGMGTLTPIGNSLEEFWNGLLSGKSGAGKITKFDTTDFTTKIACEVKDFDVSKYIEKKAAKRMDMYTQYGMAASIMAMEDANINLEEIDCELFGVIFGSGIGGMSTFEEQHTNYMEKGPKRISPFFVPMMISDIAAGQISMQFGLKGPNYATVSACATGAHAIGDAFMHIQRGSANLMLCGGSEAAITPMSIGGFNSAKALSTRNDDPLKASRPFDQERDGFLMGEGGATLVLEELEHAKKRGAKIYAELTGIGFSGDAHHLTAPAPEGEGAQRAMKAAMKDAGVKPEQIEYINAHGTSTPLNDLNETKAIKAVFGDHAYKLNVSSTKSMTGHLLGAAGAVEAAATVMALKEGKIPPTINYEKPDPELDLNYTPNTVVEKDIKFAISNVFGFGGHNASLLFQKYEG
ncbi:MAG: beta-ketoacyl-ACP synthase II [Rhodothermaceae bacterium]